MVVMCKVTIINKSLEWDSATARKGVIRFICLSQKLPLLIDEHPNYSHVKLSNLYKFLCFIILFKIFCTSLFMLKIWFECQLQSFYLRDG